MGQPGVRMTETYTYREGWNYRYYQTGRPSIGLCWVNSYDTGVSWAREIRVYHLVAWSMDALEFA